MKFQKTFSDMSKILVLASQSDKHLGLFTDLENYNHVALYYVLLKKVCRPLRLIRRCHLNRFVNTQLVQLPYKYLWYDNSRNLPLNNIKGVLVINGCTNKISLSFLRRCRSKRIPVFLLILDSLNAESLVMKGKNKDVFFNSVWTEVFSFDPEDSKRFGFTYKGFCFYSRKHSISINNRPENDLYFTGNTKGGRLGFINNSFSYLQSHGCKCVYDVQLQHPNDETIEGIHYNKRWISYDEVLERLLNSKCILEVIQANQHGPSLRYFEAIFYNKKLLTNNADIVHYPLYNPQWMRVARTPEEIDIDWLKADDEVDYHYNGEFSPIHFIDYLINRIENA